MSDFKVYIKLKPFVKQFIQHDFGTPAVFPDKGPENSTIHHFVMIRLLMLIRPTLLPFLSPTQALNRLAITTTLPREEKRLLKNAASIFLNGHYGKNSAI